MSLIDTLEAAERLTALEAIKACVGAGNWTTDADARARHESEWRGGAAGRAALIVYPRTTQAVADMVRIANEERVSLVPQGGNTGLVRGGIPGAGGDQVLVSLERMNAIRAVDARDYSLVAEAGCILARVQQAANEAGCLFPLSLASEGSAMIGGLISTNAGGIHVVRYGVMRALVLGLEAVLPNGQIFHGLSPLRKDNTGYDLKQMLIGAEGTLGIITAATLKLFPQPLTRITSFIGLRSPSAALALLGRLRRATGDQLCAFELIPRGGLELVLRHIPGTRDPLATNHPWYVLTDVTSPAIDPRLQGQVEAALAEALGDGEISDAALAASDTQAAAFWKIRETMPEAEKAAGGSFHNDVAVPVSQVPAFLEAASAAILAAWPGCEPIPFGHMGDGNIHFSVRPPAGRDPATDEAVFDAMGDLVNGIALKLGGSISAEHGIGTLKLDKLEKTADPAKLWAMRAIKQALDPNAIMNPGRVVRP